MMMNDPNPISGQSRVTRATWLEIDAAALLGNVRAIRSQLASTTQLMAVVKGNAYGHDAALVAPLLAQSPVEWLAVATADEGLALRAQGIALPILVLGFTPPWAVATALAGGLTLTIDDPTVLAAVSAAAVTHGQPAAVHVKVNTGMNRLGLLPQDVSAFLQRAQGQPGIRVEGLFTHFATADQGETAFIDEQLRRFRELVSGLTAQQLRPPLVHAANSAATLRHPAAHFDLVRCGIALYGLHPDAQNAPLPQPFRPVLSWKAQVVHVTELAAGDSVGYGRAFVAPRAMTVATLPIGYADGFPRAPQHWQTVLLHGKAAPIVGRVCMDQTMIDISALCTQGIAVAVGDEAVLLGQQDDSRLTAEEIGARTGTINYEVVSRILPRVPRILVS
jgi:alanine racemase